MATESRQPSRPGGTICVPDTNALMHYTRFDQFDWRTRIKAPQVRLIIPVAVVTEIDNKKYARRAEFWDRARDLLGLLDSYAESSPVPVLRELILRPDTPLDADVKTMIAGQLDTAQGQFAAIWHCPDADGDQR